MLLRVSENNCSTINEFLNYLKTKIINVYPIDIIDKYKFKLIHIFLYNLK